MDDAEIIRCESERELRQVASVIGRYKPHVQVDIKRGEVTVDGDIVAVIDDDAD